MSFKPHQPAMPSGFRHYLKTIFSFDLRSLALFRVCLSVIVLLDLWVRSRSLMEHYSDLGILPRSLETTLFTADWYFSFHNSFGTTWGQAVLFILHALFAIAMLVGFRTRLATFLSWVLLISLQNRNYLVLNAGDVYFRLLLFWGMFLPLGARFSLDSALKKEADKGSEAEGPFFSIATIALTFQIISVYYFSGILKEFEPSWQHGLGVYYALTAEIYTTAFGAWVGSHRDFLLFINPFVLWLEIGFGFLLFIPYQNNFFRWLCILFFWGFHISIFFMFEVGFLSTAGVVAWMIFIPTNFWNTLYLRFKNFHGTGLQIRYDEDCDTCLKILRVLIPVLGLTEAILVPVALENSWEVVDQSGQKYFEFDALCIVFSESFFGRFLVPLMRLKPIFCTGTSAYRWFASHRAEVSPLFPEWNERKLIYGDSTISQAFAGMCLISIIWMNINTLPISSIKLPMILDFSTYLMRLDQNWSMFRQPIVENGWFSIPGVLQNGNKVDLYRKGAPFTTDKPPVISEIASSDRWRKYHTSLYENKNNDYFLAYGKFLCREWNSSHSSNERLLTFQINYVREETLEAGGRIPLKEILLWPHKCFE